MTRHLTTLLLIAGCWLLVGCSTPHEYNYTAKTQLTESFTADSVIAPAGKTITWYCEVWDMTNNVWGYLEIAFEYNDDLTTTNWQTLTRYQLTTVSNSFTVPLTEQQRYFRVAIHY